MQNFQTVRKKKQAEYFLQSIFYVFLDGKNEKN